MLASTTSMVSRTRSTVCCRVIAPVSSRGAAPKTDVGQRSRGPCRRRVAVPVDEAPDAGLEDHPDPRAVLRASSRNHGRSGRPSRVAAVLSPPIERRSSATGSAARSRAVHGPECTRGRPHEVAPATPRGAGWAHRR